MNLYELIPVGRENRIHRSELANRFIIAGAITPVGDTNRDMMNLLHEIRKETVVISSGRGYYRPDSKDKEELKHYIGKERHRIAEINSYLIMATKVLADMEAGRI